MKYFKIALTIILSLHQCISYSDIVEIDKYMACSLSNSKKFLNMNAQLSALTYKNKSVFGAILPSLKYEHSLTESNNFTKYGDANPVYRKFNAEGQTLRMDFPLFNPLLYLDYLHSSNELKKMYYDVENSKFEELTESLSIYFEIFFLSQKNNLLKKNLESSTSLHNIAKNQFKRGIIFNDELQEFALLNLELNSQINLNNKTMNNYKTAQVKYCEFADTIYPKIFNDKIFSSFSKVSEDEYYELLNNNAFIISSKISIANYQYDLKKAKAEFSPTANLFISKSHQFDGKNIVIGSDNSTANQSNQIGLVVQVPIFNGLSSFNRVKQNIELVNAAELSYIYNVSSVYEKLSSYVNSFNIKLDQLALINDQINLRNNIYKVTSEKVRLGLKEPIELVLLIQKKVSLEQDKLNTQKEILLNYMKILLLVNNQEIYKDKFFISAFN